MKKTSSRGGEHEKVDLLLPCFLSAFCSFLVVVDIFSLFSFFLVSLFSVCLFFGLVER